TRRSAASSASWSWTRTVAGGDGSRRALGTCAGGSSTTIRGAVPAPGAPWPSAAAAPRRTRTTGGAGFDVNWGRIRSEGRRLAVTEERPRTDERDPAEVVEAMIDRVLALARTWVAWDGEPRPKDDRVYTPHKAIRRVT